MRSAPPNQVKSLSGAPARDAAIEGEAGDAGIGRGARHLHVRNRGANPQPRPLLDRDLAEASPQANDHALDAAVTHKKIRAQADDGDGNVGGRALHEICEVGFVGRRIENFGRSARSEPGEVLERRAGFQLAAQLRQARDQPAFEV